MDQETLFTSSKWDIIQVLAKGQKSPLELARETKTSIANISQQLRMLELANIVKSERVGNRERGEPRLLYSLLGPLSFIISASPNFAEKKQLILSPYHEIILKMWFTKDHSAHYYIEKFFWEIENKIDKIQSIAIKQDYSKIQMIIISDDSEIKKEVKSKEIKKPKGESRRVDVSVFSKEAFKLNLTKGVDFSSKDDFAVVYDPGNIMAKILVEAKI